MSFQKLRRVCLALVPFILVSTLVFGEEFKPSALVRFNEMPKPVRLPDGKLAAYFLPHGGPGLPPLDADQEQDVFVRYSGDGGQSWSESEHLFQLSSEEGGWGYFVPLLDRRGEIHFFFLNDAHSGVIRPVPKRTPGYGKLDIWHLKSSLQRTRWSRPKRIWSGRAGDIQSVIQLRSGRILLPISYLTERTWADRGVDLDAFILMGMFDVSVLYSDNDGETWQQSPSVLKVPVPNISTYGALEPVVLDLSDGRVWMMIRTQLGRLYESFSQDGRVWTDARPSRFYSSDSPVGLVRLDDGRILMLWNNCLRYPYAYGGRHVLHAAVSEDEGHSWRGYREVLQDPLRDHPPPPRGDHGVSYPFPISIGDGAVAFSLWVSPGQGRALYRLDPAWLYETSLKDDFSAGLQEWSTFGTRGVELVPHPQMEGARVLRIRKQDGSWPAAAVRNFPFGSRGRLTLRIFLNLGFQGALLMLSDHFSVPFDQQDEFHSLFNLSIGPGGHLGGGETLEPGVWHELTLEWDTAQGRLRVLRGGKSIAEHSQLRAGAGPSYLRIRSASPGAGDPGFLLEQLTVDLH